MRNHILLFPLVLFCYSCTNHSLDHNLEKVDRLVQELVEDKFALGISYGIMVGDSLATLKSYGLTHLKSGKALEIETPMRIASITKPFTATAIMQLVEKRQLTLDTSIESFFPSFPNAQNITIYHLLSHTSGIPNWWMGGMPEDEPSNFPMCKEPHVYLARMKTPAYFEAGEQYDYSNSGYVLLGEIIEQVSGQSYADYVREHILEPSGLKHTQMENAENYASNWAQGYGWNPELEQPFVELEPYSTSMPFSAGGLRSTVPDLLKFWTALLEGELVSPTTVRKMMEYSLLDSGQPVYTKLYLPEGHIRRYPPKTRNWGYGRGFEIAEKFGKKVISHGGDIFGFNAFFMYLPHNDIRFVILSNTEGGIMHKLLEMEKALIAVGVE